MSCRPILRDVPQQTRSDTSGATQHFLPNGEPRPADVEMARVLKTAPVSMASDPASGAIAHWKHGALHDVVEPMADHVIMTYPIGVQRLERRNGKSAAIGTARTGVVAIIPAGSSARWDIPGPVNVVQLYLPHRTLERVAGEADTSASGVAGANGASRSHHIPPAHKRIGCDWRQRGAGCAVRHQLNDLLATRLLAAHAGAPAVFQPALGGLAPTALRRADRAFALGPRYGRLPCRAGFGCRPVALPLLPRLQGEHGALAACLAAPAPARAGHEEDAARHRQRSSRLSGSTARPAGRTGRCRRSDPPGCTRTTRRSTPEAGGSAGTAAHTATGADRLAVASLEVGAATRQIAAELDSGVTITCLPWGPVASRGASRARGRVRESPRWPG